MKVLVCDDDKIYADEIKLNVKSLLEEKQIQADFDLFLDSNEIYNSKIEYDLAFLDVEMVPYSGIEIAKKLKSINKNIIIFFITSYDKYLDEAMDLNAFRFIKKPFDILRLRSGVEKALKYIDNSQISFYLSQNKSIATIFSHDIIFIEIVGRTTKIVLEDRVFYSDNKIDFWKSKLIASFFVQTHKSFIINMNYITKYNRDLVQLAEKYDVPVSYRNQASFRSKFFDFLGE